MSGGATPLTGAQAAQLISGSVGDFARMRADRQNADLQRRLLELQTSGLEAEQARAAQDAEREQIRLHSDIIGAQRQSDQVNDAIGDLVTSGGLTDMQAKLLRTLPADQRGTALIETTGALQAPMSAQEQADLAETQAKIRLTEAQIDDVGQTTLLRNLKGAGIDAGSEVGQSIIENAATGRQQGAEAARIAAERATAEGRAKASVARETDLAKLVTDIDSGTSAAQQLIDLSPDAVSGPGATFRNALGKFGDQFVGRTALEALDALIPGDVIPDTPEAGEIFEGIRAQFDLEARALQKGPQTDQDAKVIASTTPQLTDSREARESKARRFLATKDVIRNRAQRELELLQGGEPVADARRRALDAFPSPRFNTSGNIVSDDQVAPAAGATLRFDAQGNLVP